MTLGSNMSILGLVNSDASAKAPTLNNDGYTLTIGSGGILADAAAAKTLTLNDPIVVNGPSDLV